MSEAVTVHRPGAQIRGGDRGPGTQHTLEGVDLAPRGASTEDTANANTVTVGVSLFAADPAADVRPLDVIEYAGVIGAYRGRWEVVGEPAVWTGGPFSPGGPEGVEVALRRVTG